MPAENGCPGGVGPGDVVRRYIVAMNNDLTALRAFIHDHSRLLVLTGAGVSTASGIPDYRDVHGGWKRPPPMTLQQFMGTPLARARYWARSMLGWSMMEQAQPNVAHQMLVTLQQRGQLSLLVTQNVDGLHQKAGSIGVVDLHGNLDWVCCMACEYRLARGRLQQWLQQANPGWLQLQAETAPDGDAYLEGADFARFEVPPCPKCGDVLKPDVVFFGESVPGERVQQVRTALEQSDALLVLGSSLMVYSGYRFALRAHELGLPVAAVNHGHNRAQGLLTLKIDADCGQLLQAALAV